MVISIILPLSKVFLVLLCQSSLSCRTISKRELKVAAPVYGYVYGAHPSEDLTKYLVNESKPYTIPLEDLRNSEFIPDLETHGLTYLSGRYGIKIESFGGDMGKYKAAIEEDSVEIVKKLMGSRAKLAIAFNSALRGSLQVPASRRVPMIHSDMSSKGAQWIKTHYQDKFLNSGEPSKVEAGKCLRDGRSFVILNVWRPIKTISDDHLGLCVWDSHLSQDILDFGIRPTNTPNSIQPWKYSKGQKWVYLRNQRPDEVFVFMQHDSTAQDGHGINVPHASFRMSKDHAKVSQRTSVECRVIVFVE